MAEYIITTKDQDMSAWQATDIKDLLPVVFEYYGKKKDLINRALVGCKTVNEMVDMYNHLMPYDGYHIERIREVRERIYG